jgi:hypothetical protein
MAWQYSSKAPLTQIGNGNPLENNNLHRGSMNLSIIGATCLNKFPMLRLGQRVALLVHRHSNQTLPGMGLSDRRKPNKK